MRDVFLSVVALLLAGLIVAAWFLGRQSGSKSAAAATPPPSPRQELCLAISCDWRATDGGVNAVVKCPSGMTTTRTEQVLGSAELIGCACCQVK